jgi:hypothetical protein
MKENGRKEYFLGTAGRYRDGVRRRCGEEMTTNDGREAE